MKAEEILHDELSDYLGNIVETTPRLKEWILDAMEIYAKQRLREELIDIQLFILEGEGSGMTNTDIINEIESHLKQKKDGTAK